MLTACTCLFSAYREPLVYNFAVFREVLKHVYIAERLQPPSLSTFQSVYATLWSRARSPQYWRDLVQSGDLAKVGIYALEAYGIFKVRLAHLLRTFPQLMRVPCILDWRDCRP